MMKLRPNSGRRNLYRPLPKAQCRRTASSLPNRRKPSWLWHRQAQDQGAWCGVLYQRTGDETRSPLVYVVAPGLEEFTHPLAMEFSENYPLHLADYSDDFWDHGILSLNLESIGRQEDANRVVLFYDTPFTQARSWREPRLFPMVRAGCIPFLK